MVSSARRFRNGFDAPREARRGPPQRSSPSPRRGVRGAAFGPRRCARPALDRDDRVRRERLAAARRAPAALRSSRAGRAPRRAPPRRLVRRGQVSFSVPLASSKRSRSRRALRIGRISIGTGSAASSAASERAVDHMIFKLAGVVLADRPAARRLPGLVDRLAAAGDQIMPVAQRLARGAQPIGAGLGKPVEAAQIACGRASRNRRPASCGACNRGSGRCAGRAACRRHWSG